MTVERFQTWLRFPIACFAILAATGCGQQAESPGTKLAAEPLTESKLESAGKRKSDQALMSGEWRVISIDRTQLRGDAVPTIVFGDEGLCWGNAGINDFRTTFSIERLNHLKVGPASVTRKMGPPEAMAVEKLFLDRLQSAISYEVRGDLLFVNSGEDRNVTFERIYR